MSEGDPSAGIPLPKPRASAKRRSQPRASRGVPGRGTSANDELLFGRAELLKVFISSEMRSQSLANERFAAAEAVDEHPDAQAWMWERSANAGPYSSLEVCRGHAATSDLLVLIVSDTLTDATEVEWRAAKGAGVSCAVFPKRPSTRDQRLEAFLRAERATSIYVPFTDAADLKKRVGEMLRQSHTSAIRRGALHRRRVAYVGAAPASHLLWAGLETVEDQLWSGSAAVAGEIVAELEGLFGDLEDAREDLDLASGHVHAVLGDRGRAVEAYSRVVASPTATAVGVAVAQQNLALEALKSRDLGRAHDLMRDAIRRHADCENWFGVLQMLLNITTLAISEGRLARAKELAGLAEKLLSEAGGPLPRQETSLVALQGGIAAHEGRHSDALELFRQAWRRARQQTDREASCTYGQNVGTALADLGRPAEAVKWYRRALSIAEETGSFWRQEELHRCLAVTNHRLGKIDLALEHFESARAFAARVGDEWRVATLTADVGALLAIGGDPRADSELEKAATLLGPLNDPDWLYLVERNRAGLARKAGDRAKAAQALERALCAARSDDTRRTVHEDLAELALDKPMDARAAAEEFRLAAESATRAGAADSAWLMGRYARRLAMEGLLAPAIQMFDNAIVVAQSAEDEKGLFHLRNDRALALIDKGDLVEAREVFEAGASWAREALARDLEVQALHNFGEVQRRLGNLRESRAALTRAVALALELGDDDGWRSALALLAMTSLAEGSIEEAERQARQVIEVARRAGDKANEGAALGTLGGAEFRRGNYEAAAALYRQASRLESHDPVHYLEDLMAILESHAAAGQWRRAQRAALRVVDFAQEKELQHSAWPSLLRATRKSLDRGNTTQASHLAVTALGLALEAQEVNGGSHMGETVSEPARESEDPGEASGRLGQALEALLALAVHVESSSEHSSQDVWRRVTETIGRGSPEARENFERLVNWARESARVAVRDGPATDSVSEI